jgi:hypothetical protein
VPFFVEGGRGVPMVSGLGTDDSDHTLRARHLHSVIDNVDDQWGALACENVTLMHAGCFGEKA